MAKMTTDTNELEKVKSQFLTNKFRLIFYPNRPLFTLFLSMALATLGIIGVLPVSLAFYFALTTAVDDMVFTPFLRVVQSINNLANKRKTAKSILTLVLLTLALLGGLAFSMLVLAKSPLIVTAIHSFTMSTGSSALMIGLIATIGSIGAHLSNKVSPSAGLVLGAFIGGFIPFTIVPLSFEIAFLGTAATMFATSIISKQCMRMYYKLRYGHSNADGYDFEISTDNKPSENDKKQAAFFKKQPETVMRLRQSLLEGIKLTNKQLHFGHSITGSKWQLTNSFKDILHQLNRTGSDRSNPPSDTYDMSRLINDSREILNQNTLSDSVGLGVQPDERYSDPMLALWPTQNPDQRMKFHKQGFESALSKIEKIPKTGVHFIDKLRNHMDNFANEDTTRVSSSTIRNGY